MSVKDFYETIGGNYQVAIDRLGSDSIIKVFIQKFKEEKNYSELISAVECGDIEKSFAAAHNLKGVSGNMSFDGLFNVVNSLVEQLRPQTEIANKVLVEKITDEYEKIILAIGQLA